MVGERDNEIGTVGGLEPRRLYFCYSFPVICSGALPAGGSSSIDHGMCPKMDSCSAQPSFCSAHDETAMDEVGSLHQ